MPVKNRLKFTLKVFKNIVVFYFTPNLIFCSCVPKAKMCNLQVTFVQQTISICHVLSCVTFIIHGLAFCLNSA